MKKILVLLLLAGGSLMAAVSFGINIGPPPPPAIVAPPPAPGPGYVWVQGYYYPVGHKYHWHEGYWTRSPYAGATWVTPRYETGHYYYGYWNGEHGRVEHNHHWDKDRDRDYNRYRH